VSSAYESPLNFALTYVDIDRVSYSPERWVKIAQELARQGTSFTTEDRMGLVSDVFSLAQAGYTKTSSALELLSGLKNETECTLCTLVRFCVTLAHINADLVWQSAAGSLGSLLQVWWDQPEYDQINAFRAVRKRRYISYGSLILPLPSRCISRSSTGLAWNSRLARTSTLRSCAPMPFLSLRSLVTQSQCRYDGDMNYLILTSLCGRVLAHLKALYTKFVETNDESVIPADIMRTTLITVRYMTKTKSGAEVGSFGRQSAKAERRSSTMLRACASHQAQRRPSSLAPCSSQPSLVLFLN